MTVEIKIEIVVNKYSAEEWQALQKAIQKAIDRQAKALADASRRMIPKQTKGNFSSEKPDKCFVFR